MIKKEFNFELWQRKFIDLVNADVRVGKRWASLVKAGITGELISGLLATSCDFPNSPGYEVLSVVRIELLWNARSAIRLSHRLENIAEEMIEFLGQEVHSD